MDPLILGTLLDDRYRVLRKIGQGGEGDVYIARDEQLGCDVAIKAQFPRSFESSQTYFSAASAIEGELERLTFMSHLPGIPRVLGDGRYGLNKGRYIVMELIDGVTVESWIAEHHPVSAVAALSVVAQLCNILDGVHSEKYVHRDVCPRNAMLRTDGRACLLDVGISGKVHEVNPDYRGTPYYAPPEQYNRESRLSPQVDVFSLGVMLFAMVGTDVPYGDLEGPPDDATPPFPKGLSSEMPEGILTLALSMVSFEPRGRPDGVAEVLRILGRMLPKLGEDRPPKATQPDSTMPFRLGLPLL
ncbi:serine/threonine protein kinase [Streptomyces katsurahamanus]|uniref:serine/threonine protein kinase n=1 Tax=Streptomyces katsurahamanus TaxID=2577098 RepID=UPI0018866CFF|nr:serine/threonine-protein kinase [Streptomyces katsurahamanus]